jgi:sulfite exporter TauE/SafE
MAWQSHGSISKQARREIAVVIRFDCFGLRPKAALGSVMIEWPLIFLGGLLGSSHCIGMCGAFALTIGLGTASALANARRQFLYSLGRIFTYSFAGAVAGFAGMRLTRYTGQAFHAQAALAMVAGALLVVQGMHSAGFLPRFWKRHSVAGFCPSHGLFRSFLTAPGWHNAFLAGLLTGFLPCGLVYAYLVLAAGSGNIVTGMAIMALFGAGTVPLMVLTGVGSSFLTVNARHYLFRAAAVCVIATGVITINRGIGWARSSTTEGEPICPFCAPHVSAQTQSPAFAGSQALPGNPMRRGSASRIYSAMSPSDTRGGASKAVRSQAELGNEAKSRSTKL